MRHRLVILDRDGVINHDSADFIKSADEWRAIDGSAEAIGRLTMAGFTVVVATNQSGLGRGLVDVVGLEEIHREMGALVAQHGGSIEAIVFCPHLPDEDCECRKPKAGLLLELGSRFNESLERVPLIGDSMRDLDAAVAVGARPILVLTGNGEETAAALRKINREVDTFANLADAATALIAEEER